LCATKTTPDKSSIILGATSSKNGATLTISSSIPVRVVIKGGIGTPGFTSV
jgi:hypothetical protein